MAWAIYPIRGLGMAGALFLRRVGPRPPNHVAEGDRQEVDKVRPITRARNDLRVRAAPLPDGRRGAGEVRAHHSGRLWSRRLSRRLDTASRKSCACEPSRVMAHAARAVRAVAYAQSVATSAPLTQLGLITQFSSKTAERVAAVSFQHHAKKRPNAPASMLIRTSA